MAVNPRKIKTVLSITIIASISALLTSTSFAGAKRVSVEATATQALNLAQYRGKVVYLDFWASWCKPCKQSIPWMNQLQRELGPQGLVVVGVNVDVERADADAFLAKYPADFRIVYDPKGKLAEKFKLKGMPQSFVISPNGKVVGSHAGFKKGDAEKLGKVMRKVMDKLKPTP